MSTTVPRTPAEATREIAVNVNGVRHVRSVPVRMLLSDFLRHELGLTGTHVGCEHGVCGACTVNIDGRSGRSCLALAVQCDGADVRTVESLADTHGELHPLQQAFHECHALQCGFCTPGFLMAVESFLAETPRADFSEEELREALSGNLCRCTGYTNIIDAVRLAAQRMYGEGEAD
jgi:aerobic-type carbon monoxide dehydrogenase small subunit (CoxS/CutS family)